MMRIKWNLMNFTAPSQPPLLQNAMVDNPLEGRIESTLVCRCCGSKNVRSRGKLPDAKVFAGAQLEQPLPGGKLYHCNNCKFVFRAPIFSKQSYDALYRAGVSTTWNDEQRIDHELVREALQTYLTSGTVLDVGCSAGNLLMPLTDRYYTFGAEINIEAADMAEARGVHIVTHDLADVAQLPRVFDAVVSCDVIEHVVNPLELMQMLLAKTSANGLVIISTGNAYAWSWRLLGSRFWYCYLPEHISFVSPAWFEHYTRQPWSNQTGSNRMESNQTGSNQPGTSQLDADIIQIKRFIYSPKFPWRGKALRLVLMTLFRISPKLYYRLLPKAKRHNIPVGRGITRDHFLIVLRKR